MRYATFMTCCVVPLIHFGRSKGRLPINPPCMPVAVARTRSTTLFLSTRFPGYVKTFLIVLSDENEILLAHPVV